MAKLRDEEFNFCNKIVIPDCAVLALGGASKAKEGQTAQTFFVSAALKTARYRGEKCLVISAFQHRPSNECTLN